MLDSNSNTEDDGLFLRYEFDVDGGQEPLRIDKYLVNRIENATRSKVQEAIDKGNVKVNDKSVKSSYKVKPADHINVLVDKEVDELIIVKQDIPLDIIYEDDTILVVNKKAGMVVHPGFGNPDNTLLNALAFHFDATESHSDTQRPWLVHRIDKGTSGLLVIAKTDDAIVHLSKQFKAHTTERTYQALVWGSFEETEGTINRRITRDKHNRKKFTVTDDESLGKHAITHYKVLKDFMYVSLIECKLETGRTHQIRVHLQNSGHTLFNDEFYGGHKILKGVVFSKYKKFIENCFKILPRQALHAKTLGFVHPKTGKMMQFDTDLPEDMQGVLDKWTKVTDVTSFN